MSKNSQSDQEKLDKLFMQLKVDPVDVGDFVASINASESGSSDQQQQRLNGTSYSGLSVGHANGPLPASVIVNGNNIKHENGGLAPGPSSSKGIDLELLLQEYKAQRESKNANIQERLEEQRKANAIPPLFNRKKVPKALLEQIQSLPIYADKDKIVQAVKDNQMVIIMGDTGSGKSTQIPQYLVEAGFTENGKIGITQPRRVAAKSLAERVSKECGVKLGTTVGYAVRFDKVVSGNTVIKYMTDGLLVKEFASEPHLNLYSVIIIDEAHERSIHTDVCFGLLKRAAKARPELRIIISSATLEEEKFSSYFNNAPVIKVSGRGYPVEILYEPRSRTDYVQGAVDTIFKIHSTQPPGDVLVFLTGQEEIENIWDLLENGIIARGIPQSKLLIMPCYGALPLEEQQQIFDETPAGTRKIVLATNIAETSLTIDGIVYVVDCGYYKQNEYNPKTGIDSLILHKITRFQAIQRAGRAGRTRPGKCFRLYSKHEFAILKKSPVPEIKRCNVNSVVLDLIAMGVPNPMSFEFMDLPPNDAIMETLEHLQELGALDAHLGLTDLGRRMSKFPLDPPLAKTVIVSADLGCSSEVLKIVALLSTQFQNLFKRQKKMRASSDSKKATFNQPEGDHLTLLKVYNDWKLYKCSEDWCKSNFINHRHLVEAEEIRVQLRDILYSHGLQETTCGLARDKIQKAFTAGYFRQIAKKKVMGHAYEALSVNQMVNSSEAFLHPSSSLFYKKPTWVIYHEIVKTSKPYMRGSMVIEPEWLRQYAPEFTIKLRRVYGNILL